MPKLKMCALVFFLFSAFPLFADDGKKANVFYGYGDIKWGSSSEILKSRYENLTKGNPIDKGSVLYEQTNPTKLIKKRSFSFYKDQLYKVYIELNTDLSSDVYKVVIDKLLTDYGKPHNVEDKKDVSGNFYIKGTTLSWLFNNGDMYLDVKVWDILNEAGYHVEQIVVYLYICEPIKNELEKANSKDILDDLNDL